MRRFWIIDHLDIWSMSCNSLRTHHVHSCVHTHLTTCLPPHLLPTPYTLAHVAGSRALGARWLRAGIQAQTAECLVLGELATDTLLVALNKVCSCHTSRAAPITNI